MSRLLLSAELVLKSSTNVEKREPSVSRKIGRATAQLMSVESANWLPTPPMRSLRPAVSISFLFSLARNAAKTLARHAASSAHTEKSSSLSEAMQTPPITGIRQSHLAVETDLP